MKKKGRPKSEHKTIISARLTDEAIDFLNKAHNYYGVNKSAFINNAIIYFYRNLSKIYIQKCIKYDGN